MALREIKVGRYTCSDTQTSWRAALEDYAQSRIDSQPNAKRGGHELAQAFSGSTNSSEMGSIEPGKFADLVILNKDPRKDIRDSRAIAAVMRNGRLYSADTLDEIWPRQRAFGPQWFDGERPPPGSWQ
jgi:hypothetical protein